MKTNKIIMIAALATLAVGCSKDRAEGGFLQIVSENMQGGNGSKVLVDPTNPSGATWVAGDSINLNGVNYIIEDNEHNGYRLGNVEPLNVDMYAVYPAGSDNYNDFQVTNNYAAGTGSVIINRLTIDFDGNGSHKVHFPMAAKADANAGNLLFRHLTAGFKMTLKNTSVDDIEVATVKIIARSDNPVQNLGIDEDDFHYSARWAVEGPSVPSGEVGGNTQDWNVGNSSEMLFDLVGAGASVPANGTLSFCVPVTITSVHYLTIVGYNAAGNEIFQIHKNLGTELLIERNTMYPIPEIIINNID